MLRHNYPYDANGNVTTITDLVHSEKSQTFTYDTLDRLRTAVGGYGSLEYQYDASGNRVRKVENGAVTDYAYVAGSNRLEGLSGAEVDAFGYDGGGDTSLDGDFSLTYFGSVPIIGRYGGDIEENKYIYVNRASCKSLTEMSFIASPSFFSVVY